MLHQRLTEVLKKKGIVKLTPVQKKALPYVLKGFHCLIMAPTGSGKTEAALLPVASRMLERAQYGKLRLLYITPLRALNRDIGLRAFELFKEIGMSVEVWHGDTPSSRRKKIIVQPPEVLVTTPESFNILLVNKAMKKHLKHVKYIIIDELHELIESKRGVELTVALERLAETTKFQRIGISATISNVNEAKRFLAGHRYVVEISDTTRKTPELNVIVDESFENMVAKLKKTISEADGTVLVFTNTRDTAEQLGRLLREELGDDVYVHHGSLSKKERNSRETC